MRLCVALVSVLGSIALAEDVVTFYLNPTNMLYYRGLPEFTPVASLASSSSSTLSMSVGCASSVPSESCLVNDGLNYTIISENTYIGAWTSANTLSWSMGFTCVHNTEASNVICGEETSNNGRLGLVTKQMVYSAMSTDFLTASVVGGKQFLSTATLARSGVTGGTATPTGSVANSQSTGAATRAALDGSIAAAMAVAAFAATW